MLQCAVSSQATLYLVSGLTILGLVVYLIRYGVRSNTIIWLRTFFIFVALYLISTSLMRCSQTSSEFHIAYTLFTFAIALMLPSLLIFTLHFINREKILDNLWVRISLLTTSSSLVYIFWLTNYFINRNFAKASPGYGLHTAGDGEQPVLFGLTIAAVYLIPIVIMYFYQRKVENHDKKREIRLVIFALSVTIVSGTVFEALIPTLFAKPTYPVTPFATMLMAGLVTFAILRYGLHVFNVNDAADNIMQIMPGGLLILDHTDTIQYLNDGASQMLGYSNGHLAGASASKLFANREVYKSFQKKVLAGLTPGNQIAGEEMVFVTKSKAPLAVSLNAVSVYAADELINRYIAFTDITLLKQTESALKDEKASVERKVIERTKELNEAESQLMSSIRSLPFGFAVIDKEERILFANEMLGKLMDMDISGDTGYAKSKLEAIDNKYKSEIEVLELIRNTQTKKHHIERNITFGTQFFRFFFMPITNHHHTNQNEVLGTVLIMEDVTEAKTIERSRDEFFSIASHELRTPLTAIRGNTSMIMKFYGEQLKDPELHTMVDDIHSASLRLIDIVNDFLDASRLEMGKVTYEIKPFDVTMLVTEIVRNYDVTGSRKGVHIGVEPNKGGDLWAMADADRTRQILVNLMGNGIKATSKGEVTISINIQENRVVIDVKDTGTGIPAESQHLLFHKFQQASNNILTRDNTQSTGLGLYISKLMAEGMKCKLYLKKSILNEGSTFTLELPKSSKPKSQ
jgi:two-component system phosphate regulon sensor histidine kinase PhoR